MKRILIIGASILQLPAIKKAKEMGLYVGVLDMNPDAVGVSYADEFFCISTIDIDNAIRAAQKFEPDGVITLATDMPMRTIAAICEKLGLCGISIETALKSTDKVKMIEAFRQHGVSHPWFLVAENKEAFDKLKNKVRYPCIIKPTDSSGSRGVVLIKNEEELEASYEYTYSSSRNGAVIIEEYLAGPEVSVEVIVINNEAHILQITDKLTTGAPHFVEMGHSQPSQLPESTCELIKQLAGKATEAVGIENGAAHVEMIITQDGPKMVELGARMGGDCITTHLVPLSTGIDMIESVIQIALGEVPDIEKKYDKGAAIRYFSQKVGVVKSINGLSEAESISGIRQISIVHGVGEKIEEIHSSSDRMGFVIAQDDDAIKAIEDCDKALQTIEIELE